MQTQIRAQKSTLAAVNTLTRFVPDLRALALTAANASRRHRQVAWSQIGRKLQAQNRVQTSAREKVRKTCFGLISLSNFIVAYEAKIPLGASTQICLLGQTGGRMPCVLRHSFSYNYLEQTGNDLVGLANILGHDNDITTQIYTQKPLGALQNEIEKVQFF